MALQTEPKKSKPKELFITRTIDAPRQLVWEAWIVPERMMQWWGPEHFTSPACRIDARVGGEYLCAMRSPEGKDYWNTGTFCVVDAPEQLVMTDSFADEKGNVVSAEYYGMSPGWPKELLNSVKLEEAGKKTRLSLRVKGIDEISETDRENMRQGWEQSLDKLADYLAKAQK